MERQHNKNWRILSSKRTLKGKGEKIPGNKEELIND